MMIRMPEAFKRFNTETESNLTFNGFRYKLRQLNMVTKPDNFHDAVEEKALNELIEFTNSKIKLSDMVKETGISGYKIRAALSYTEFKIIKNYDVEMFENEEIYNNVREYLREQFNSES